MIAERFGAIQVIPSLATIVAQTASDASDAGAYNDPSEIQDALRGEAQRTLAAARAGLASLDRVGRDPQGSGRRRHPAARSASEPTQR